MKDEEKKALEQTQNEIKKESKTIADSISRILLLGGPLFVEALLLAMMKANDEIKKKLNLKVNVNFEEKTT